MIRTCHVCVALAFGALLAVAPSTGVLAQEKGCNHAVQAQGSRPANAQAEPGGQKLAQAENSSSGGGMYGRQYSQAEGNRQNSAQAGGDRANTPQLASGTDLPSGAPCP